MFGWREVYHGYDLSRFSQVLDILKAQGILAKTKVRNMRNRMGSHAVMQGNPAAINTAGMASMQAEYRIYVKKAHAAHARQLL